MPSILFIKTSSLGDVVHQCAAVSDAANALPGAQIDWVIEESFAGVAALHSAVRRVIPVAVRRWRSTPWRTRVWSEMAAFRRALREHDYDRVIDTQGLLKSALVAALASGPRHGYDRESARESLASYFYDIRHSVPKSLHAVERNRRLTAAALGYDATGACDYGVRARAANPIGPGNPYVVLLTMTSRPEKLWSEADWIGLGLLLAEAGLRAVLPWGTDQERERCARIAHALEGAVVPPRLPLAAVAALLAGARGVVGVDTGLTHLAAALGVATVGVYRSTDPALTGVYAGARSANAGGIGQAPSARAVLDQLEQLW